jgi:amidase|tara:strand:+ start:1203 stop:2621 length:1419 start_codon:yes stop_codon:yes gene_type:complete
VKFSEYSSYDGLGLAELIAQGEISATEVAEIAYQAIESRNPHLNAVLGTVRDQPFSEGKPFTGVPFLVKELILQAKGTFSRAGSRATPAIEMPADSNLMSRFRSAGLQLLGTTQTPEMGYNATTETVAFGPVNNPWKAGISAGGSSGGSGAAVASGLVPIAHANDGGGSIRIPASCNGLVGLKPSRDRTPTGPGSSDPLFSHGIEFVLTRSVRDSAALLDCVAGPDVGAPHFIAAPEKSFADAAASPMTPVKVAFVESSLLGLPIHEECAIAANNTAKLLEEMGHTLIPCPIVLDFEEFAENINIVWCAFASQFVAEVSSATGCKVDNDNFEAVTLTCADFGAKTTAPQILNALDYVNRISRETATAFEDFDVILSSTMSAPPAVHGFLNQNDELISAIDWTRKTFQYASNTPLFNSTGQPAISLPTHWNDDGLPIGTQLAAGMGQEGLLLSLASNLESACDWKSRQSSLWS